ncbi:xanthine dehydrogenase family protein molybdopterin-binding subunit [Yunchengibacter salinarum]|uniref:xanthine dehydrogenase family protein molybdopterin-binding subunit n=1 Tax=Yunchengibacter salinarum TaxID=3133399 RepID=UPI0035B5CD10
MTDTLEKLGAAPTRRGVLQGLVAAGGLVLAAPVFADKVRAEATGKAGKLATSAYLALDVDGTAHIYVHRVEMGQGSRTGLPQIVADELGAAWDRLHLVPAYGDKKFGDQNTDGSTSIRKFYEAFRRTGAAARMMLERAAADAWGVSPDRVRAANHTLTNLDSGETAPFADFVAAAARLDVPKDDALVFRKPSERAYVGKPKRIVDMMDIVTGQTRFGQDAVMEDMLYAVAARPDELDARLDGYDREAALAVPGVEAVMELPSSGLPVAFNPMGGVAVLATNTHAAMKGREALKARFKKGRFKDWSTEAEEKALWQSIDGESETKRDRGDVDAAMADAAESHSADYFVPYHSHVPMEPPAALAFWQDDGDGRKRLHIHAPCQDPQAVQSTVAPFVDEKAEDIYVEATLLGGAFGRKSKPDFCAEAAVLAKQAGRPVKMVWTREDDVMHDYYHAIAAQRVQAGLDGEGRVTAYRHKAVYPSIGWTFSTDNKGPADFELSLGLLDVPFETPNLRIERGFHTNSTRIGWLRSVNNIQQAFAIGSFVDELAHKRGVDPVDQWLEMIGSDRVVDPKAEGAPYSNYGEDPARFPIQTARLKGVLKKAADMAGWGRDPGENRGLGIAVHRSFVSYVACAMEVVVDNGQLSIPRAWMAVDCGLAINPDRVRAQMEGAVVFALSHALYGEITAKDGVIQQDNFDSYRIARISDAPEVETAIMPMDDQPPGGVGEPGVPPVAPALANAIFQATGKRLRRLPVGDQLTA